MGFPNDLWIDVECDKCGYGDYTIIKGPLVTLQSYEVARESLRADGWTFDVDKCHCPTCSRPQPTTGVDMPNPFEELKLSHEESLRAAGKMLDEQWLTAALEEWENLERWQLPNGTRAQWLICKAKEHD